MHARLASVQFGHDISSSNSAQFPSDRYSSRQARLPDFEKNRLVDKLAMAKLAPIAHLALSEHSELSDAIRQRDSLLLEWS